MVKKKDELGDELCNYCPLDQKGIYGTPGGITAGCEGIKCGEAYEIYMEELEDTHQEDKCKWVCIDDGTMGFSDYEWRTSCGQRYSCETTKKGNFCPHCGKQLA